MVTDPETLTALSHQWEKKPPGQSWTTIQGATGQTYTTTDYERGGYVRLIQKTDAGATGLSNELQVSNILQDDLSLGQKPGRPIEIPNTGYDNGAFTAIGGGVGQNDVMIFYQGDEDGYYLRSNGQVEDWKSPIGGDWNSSYKSPWGGAAHTQDGKWIVNMPGNIGKGEINRSKNGTFDSNDRPSMLLQLGLTDYPTYGQSGNTGNMGGYCSGCTGSNVKPTRFYGTPSDLDRVVWIDTDPTLPEGSAQSGMININLNGSTGDLNSPRKWGMGALAGNGKIYCFPNRFATREMLIIDTNTDTAEIGPYIDESRNPGSYYLYSSGVMGKDGCLYFLANQAYSCWKLDPADDSLTEFGTGERLGADGSVGADPNVGFGQASLYPDGFIYCKQKVGGEHWLIQLNTDDLTWKRWKLNSNQQRAWARIFLDYDANLYWTPSPTTQYTVDLWNRGYGRGPWPMPGVPGGILDPRLPFFNHAMGA